MTRYYKTSRSDVQVTEKTPNAPGSQQVRVSLAAYANYLLNTWAIPIICDCSGEDAGCNMSINKRYKGLILIINVRGHVFSNLVTFLDGLCEKIKTLRETLHVAVEINIKNSVYAPTDPPGLGNILAKLPKYCKLSGENCIEPSQEDSSKIPIFNLAHNKQVSRPCIVCAHRIFSEITSENDFTDKDMLKALGVDMITGEYVLRNNLSCVQSGLFFMPKKI